MPQLIIAGPLGNVGDPEKDLSFTSNRTCITEIQEMSGTIGVSESETIPHNLEYYPSYVPWVRKDFGSGTPEYGWTIDPSFYSVDQNNVYIEGANGTQYACKVHSNAQDGGGGSGNNNVSGNLIIAKSGIDLKTNTDARSIQFMSGKNVPKIDRDLSGQVSQSIPPGGAEIRINHNLGYVPVVYVKSTVSGQMLPIAEPEGRTYYVTSTQVVILVDNYDVVNITETLKYLILRDKII